jgi:hypothetical protein
MGGNHEPGVAEPSGSVDQLGVALRELRIRDVVADDWASYRLTFAWHENPIVVPKNEVEDRDSPYRDAFSVEPVVAYVFDAYGSRERLEDTEASIRRGETPFEPTYDRFQIDTFTVLKVPEAFVPGCGESTPERSRSA